MTDRRESREPEGLPALKAMGTAVVCGVHILGQATTEQDAFAIVEWVNAWTAALSRRVPGGEGAVRRCVCCDHPAAPDCVTCGTAECCDEMIARERMHAHVSAPTPPAPTPCRCAEVARLIVEKWTYAEEMTVENIIARLREIGEGKP